MQARLVTRVPLCPPKFSLLSATLLSASSILSSTAYGYSCNYYQTSQGCGEPNDSKSEPSKGIRWNNRHITEDFFPLCLEAAPFLRQRRWPYVVFLACASFRLCARTTSHPEAT
jgi:hypothetical protein